MKCDLSGINLEYDEEGNPLEECHYMTPEGDCEHPDMEKELPEDKPECAYLDY